jgi:uncharacterized membrane protein YkoI
MRKRTIIIITTVAALAAGGTAIAAGARDDDATERPISGDALEKAKAAARADTPGRVTGTETGDEESYYEVEVTLDDGSQTDVQLDRGFNVVGGETDSGEEDESGEG